ncbi:MAG: DUF2779 domain-containing protein [Gammaproteobacteria bacterium]
METKAMRFSKTSIIAGLQCAKHLYLKMHHPELSTPIVSPMMTTGDVVEQHARSEFSDAAIVERSGEQDPFKKTQALIADTSVNAIFQAALRHDGVEVYVDVLQRDGEAWSLIEIKAASGVKDHHIDDVTIQAWVALKAGLNIKNFKIMHINSGFVYQGHHDYSGLIYVEDVSERVHSHLVFIDDFIGKAHQIVAGSQPGIHIGSHCNKPYSCEFKAYCESVDARYPVSVLPNGQKVVSEMMARGIYDLRDIPVDALRSDTHLRVRNITVRGEAELDLHAAQILNELEYPRYYLDFECIQFAIPVWFGTRPYQQIPFQFSCHVERDQDNIEHEEFLDVTGLDPRRQFAKTLLTTCGDRGPVIVYNQSFEKRVIKELAEQFDDLAEALLSINTRVFDLLPIVKNHYYHPDMKGSWSIKKVLPCLVPELRYDALGEVQDGTQAQQAYLQIYGGTLTPLAQDKLIEDMRAYCALDTLAMVKIVERLKSP